MTDVLVRLLQRLRLYGLTKRVRDRLLALAPSGRRRTASMLSFNGRFVRAGDLCFDVNESMQFQLTSWVGPQEILKELTAITDYRLFGDVYARLKSISD
jgi:hypothetical protein